MTKLTYTAIDFETSGIDPEINSPVEVCAVRVVEGEPTATFNALIYYPPSAPWTAALDSGHHSREDLLKGLPESQAARILHFILSGTMLVAYNALFDLSFLRAMYIRELGYDAGLVQKLTFIDPCTISRDRDTYPHKLVDACRRRGIDMGNAHLALDDTLAMVELTNRMHEEQDITPYINVAGYPRQYGLPKYAFWLPPHVQTKPQGKETFYHHADGSTSQQTFIGKPYQPVIMGKPVAPPQPVRMSPGGMVQPPPQPQPPRRPMAPPPPGN